MHWNMCEKSSFGSKICWFLTFRHFKRVEVVIEMDRNMLFDVEIHLLIWKAYHLGYQTKLRHFDVCQVTSDNNSANLVAGSIDGDCC